MNDTKLRKLVLAAMFSALIVIMTVVPYLGYINYGGIEITTLAIPVILAAIFLGWKYGIVIGGVWGVTCLIRAYTNPLWISAGFGNPLISVLPRMLVGMVAGLVFMGLVHVGLNKKIAAGITAAAGSLTNTVLVLTAMYIRGTIIGEQSDFMVLLKNIWQTLVGINGAIELAVCIVLIMAVYAVLQKNVTIHD